LCFITKAVLAAKAQINFVPWFWSKLQPKNNDNLWRGFLTKYRFKRDRHRLLIILDCNL